MYTAETVEITGFERCKKRVCTCLHKKHTPYIDSIYTNPIFTSICALRVWKHQKICKHVYGKLKPLQLLSYSRIHECTQMYTVYTLKGSDKLNFEQISKLVAGNYDIPGNADLTDQQAYHSLKSLNFQYKNRMVSKRKASSEKEKIIKAHREQREKVDSINECLDRQVKNIHITEQLRMKLNVASRDGKLSKQLWLDAIECINRSCGSVTALKSCEKYLEGIEYEEQECIEL